MTYLNKMILAGLLAALAACTNATGYDGGGSAGAGGSGAGSAGDPASPAYFQQAIGDRVLFAVDQSDLSSEAQSTLQAQAEWLMRNSDYSAVIEGHADEQGTREYNLALGARRANAARESPSILPRRGQAGVVSMIVKATSLPSIFKLRIILSDTRSRCSSGSITVDKALITLSSVTPVWSLSCPNIMGISRPSKTKSLLGSDFGGAIISMANREAR